MQDNAVEAVEVGAAAEASVRLAIELMARLPLMLDFMVG